MSNVVKFPIEERHDAEQLDLFGKSKGAYHKYCVLDISNINQNILLGLLSRFEATHIIDTRELPVFRKPKFKTNEILDFIKNSKIEYFSIHFSELSSSLLETERTMIEAHSILKRLNIVLIFESTSNENQMSEYKNFFDRKRYAQEAILNY